MKKRRRADRREWRRIIAARFSVRQLATPAFTGDVTLLLLDRFGEPYYSLVDDRPCRIAATGYSWLQHFPAGARHTVTTMFDAEGNVVQWYIDICRQHGTDADGVPWFDDLYLDIVVSPTGAARLLDADELDAALREGLVSQADHAVAWGEARRLLAAIAHGAFPLLGLSIAHRTLLMESPTKVGRLMVGWGR